GTSVFRRTTGVRPIAWRTVSATSVIDMEMLLLPLLARLTAGTTKARDHEDRLYKESSCIFAPSCLTWSRRHAPIAQWFHLTHNVCMVVRLPQRSNQSIPSLTRSNFSA